MINLTAVQGSLTKWMENPFWREYWETAPSERCRELIALEFYYSEYMTHEAVEAMRSLEESLSLEDWKHLYRYCGINPRRGFIAKRIRELENR